MINMIVREQKDSAKWHEWETDAYELKVEMGNLIFDNLLEDTVNVLDEIEAKRERRRAQK